MNQAPSGIIGFQNFRASSYFNALDGLRAIAIFMVLAHHVPRYPDGHPLLQFQENGRYGVAFFFVISGFLICTLFLREEQKNGRIDFRRFYARRAIRLLPLYYAALLFQAALVFGFHHHSVENQILFKEKLPSYLLYFSNWLPTATQGPFFCAWSLAVEEQFYLVFGLLLFLGNRRVVIGAIVGALLLKALVYNFIGNVDVGSTLWRVVFSYQEPIFFGVLIAYALNERRWYEFFVKWLAPNWVPAGLAIAVLFMLGAHHTETQSAWDAQLLYLLMALLMVSLVIRARTPVVDSAPLVHVGRISYGIYLLHMFVLGTIKPFLAFSPVVCLLATSAVVIVLASLVYRYFEQPIILHFKKRMTPGGRQEKPKEKTVTLESMAALEATSPALGATETSP
jgi:peptidoglycan/LPS O-acetylase OafA/YrhL